MATTMGTYTHNATALPEVNVSLNNGDPDLSLQALQEALLSWRPDLWDVTKVAVLLLSMLLSLVGNGFLVSVSRVLFHQSAVLRTLLLSMAAADLLLALSVPLHLLVLVLPRFLKVAPVCVSLHASVAFYITLTLGHMVLLATDRIVALRHPLRFFRFFKPWHAVALLLLIWTYAAFSAGALLVWQLESSPWPCHPELYLGRIYRILHLSEYAGGALLTLVMLFTVYFLSCEKRRTKQVQRYVRKRRRTADYSLRRNKLFTETILAIASLFLAMCGPYMGIQLIHIFTKRTVFTAAVENIGMLVVVAHSFVNGLVLPWKLRSYRYRCLYCACPCLERQKGGLAAESEDEGPTDNVRQLTIGRFDDIGESNTDSLYKSAPGADSLEKARNNLGYLPNITITDYDSQKRITLHTNGEVDDKHRNDFMARRRHNDVRINEDDDPVWSTLTSSKLPLTDDEDFVSSTANLYFLNPVDNDFLDIPREDDV